MTNLLLDVHGLQKSFGGVAAVRNVCFSVPAAAITGLIGPNGSGKTSVLACVAGVLDATREEILLNGTAANAQARRNYLFYMPENIRPWPSQRVGWALRFFSGVHNATMESVRGLVDRLSLGKLLESRLNQLSKGEHRRVLLALALMTKRPLLLLDEPFDGLDIRQTRDVMTLLRSEVDAGRTLLLSIHQLADAARVCDHFVLLDGGTVVGEGSLNDLRARAGLANASIDDVFLSLTDSPVGHTA